MKKYSYSILLFVIFAFLGSSCVEDLPTKYEFTGYQFSNLDANAGQWKLVLHTSNEQIPLSTPAATGSPELLKELADAKEKQKNATSAQREAVAYWTNNPLVRWNEIALELATKYNLIPAPNPDGSYPVPDPANPSNYPKFPYSHPPYTSRMLAHLSVAQYDGLIMAWHYKYKFKRQAPYQLDPQIKSAYETNGLFSYPSDGAVIAKASQDVLTAMFPLEKEFLAQKAQEHLESLVVAGINVSSDVEAGKLIGAAVAKTALTRASTDGMKNAQTTRAKSDSIKNAAKDRFGWVWENQETPQRMVGLVPLFGKVRLWNVPNVESVRPGPPPAPGSPAFEESAKALKQYATNLTTNQRRIANFWNDGLSTYTPPGHWNRFAKEEVVANKLNPVRTARVFAYLNMAIADAGIACWDAKYYYHYPRPIQTIPGFKTILGTPNFPAYTSGHAAFSGAAAEVMAHFFPSNASQFRTWAEEAAMSRIYGGIHYQFDADAGLDQGRQAAGFSVAKAKLDGVD
jgi:membrane-associated phospholipid phosphatase